MLRTHIVKHYKLILSQPEQQGGSAFCFTTHCPHVRAPSGLPAEREWEWESGGRE